MRNTSTIIITLTVLLTLTHTNTLAQENTKYATFAGGCFWCLEHPFDIVEGVQETISGYIGGTEEDANYKAVCTGRTDHYEAVQVKYDPEKVNYKKLLQVFWRQIDPTDPGGQFADRGPQYKTAIFFHDEEQKKLAEESIRELDNSGIFEKPIVTEIISAMKFYEAEDYHQNYYQTCPGPYERYSTGSGRKGYIERMSKLWEKQKDLPHGE